MAGGTSWTPDSILDIQDQNRALANRLLDSLPTEQPLEGGWWINDGLLTSSEPTPPTITLQPESLSVLDGQSATFVIAADNATSYQWLRNGEPIEGATSQSYEIVLVSLDDSGAEFECVVTGPGGSVVSDTVTLSVSEYDFAALFANGEDGGFWLPADESTLFADSAGTTLAGDGDRVGQIADKSGNGRHAIQATSGNRATRVGRKLQFDSGHSLVASFGSSMGSACTVAIAIPGVGADIRGNQTLGTSYTINRDAAAVLVINRNLTSGEISELKTYFDSLSTLGGTVRLMEDLIDSQHTAGFIELWAIDDGNGVNNAAPGNPAIPVGDTNGDIVFEHTVSGAAGDISLSVSAGDESLFGAPYGAVIQHDDGSWGRYAVLTMGSGSCTIYPRLKATTTAKTMRNSGSAANGQHETRAGYRQMAWEIMQRTRGEAYRGRHVFTWRGFDGLKSAWTPINVTNAQHNISTNNAFVGSGLFVGTWISRDTMAMRIRSSQRPYTGRGAYVTMPLGGETGFIEFFVSCILVSFRVEVIVDGVTQYDVTFDDYDGLRHIVVPFTAANEAVVRIRRTADEDIFATTIVDRVTAWAYDRDDPWGGYLVDENAKTVVIGDSWTRWADDQLTNEMQAIMSSRGGTGEVINVGQGGMTAEWGLANFDTLVAPHNPEQVVILFFTNDKNTFGAANYNRWLGALYEIGRKCQAIGARPIFINPSPTQSIAQSADHGIWASRIGLGLPLE